MTHRWGANLLHFSADYFVARLARDFPEIYEFKSVAAAAKEAGIYPDKPKRTTASPDKTILAKSLLQAYGPDGCEELIDVLRDAIAQARAEAIGEAALYGLKWPRCALN